MPDLPISGLPAANPLDGTELTAVVQGGVTKKDGSLSLDVLTLKNNEYKISYFASIASASGAITKPTTSTILLGQLAAGFDAYVSTIQNGQPTGIFPQTSGGATVVVSSFDVAGNYVLSGTPSAFPVALIYVLKIKAVNYANLTVGDILDLESINLVQLPATRVAFGSPLNAVDSDPNVVFVKAGIIAPSYANPLGTGNRVGLITISTNISFSGSDSELINGAFTDTCFFGGSGNPTLGSFMTFDFGSQYIITESKWYQDSTSNQGVWQWEGSNDNSTWTSVGGTFSLGTSAVTIINTLSANTVAYRYYRMNGVSGTYNSSPYLREIEFKISATSGYDLFFLGNASSTKMQIQDGGQGAGKILISDPSGILSYSSVIKVSGSNPHLSAQVGNAGLSSGDVYQDTAANILANGDKVLGIKV